MQFSKGHKCIYYTSIYGEYALHTYVCGNEFLLYLPAAGDAKARHLPTIYPQTSHLPAAHQRTSVFSFVGLNPSSSLFFFVLFFVSLCIQLPRHRPKVLFTTHDSCPALVVVVVVVVAGRFPFFSPPYPNPTQTGLLPFPPSTHTSAAAAHTHTMSLVLLANFCSHLQNASKAHLGLTAVQSTRQLLVISLLLQSNGLLSSVTRGSVHGPDTQYTPTVQDNVATRRLWLGLKYFDNSPVMSSLKMVSIPTKRVYMGVVPLKAICMGKSAEYVKGLQPGEVLVVSTDRGIMEARDAVSMMLGGQLLCRVS